MELRRFLIFTLICFWNIQIATSQCPNVNFSLPANACTFENFQIVNSSQPGALTWDFCADDFSNTPTAQSGVTLSAAIGRPSMEFAKDGEKWFAFVTGTWTNNLYRLEFQNGISKAPTLIQNLGDVSGKLNGPGAIRVIHHNGNWFGLVHNTTNGELLKLSFGSSLSNSIEGTTVLVTGIGSINNGMAVEYDDIEGWVCIVSTTSNQFQLLRLGINLTAPAPEDILTTGSVPNPNNLGDVDLIKQCDQWFAYANNFGNGNVYRLSFGSSLFQQPTIDQVTNLGSINGGRLRVMNEGDNYFLAVTSLGGAFFKVDLGNDLSIINPTVEDEGNFGSVLQNSYGLAVAKDSSYWNISVVDQGTGKISTVNYSTTCTINELVSDPSSPVINYAQPGNYRVALTLTSATNISSTLTKSISISGLMAPDIELINEGICANNDIQFTSENVSGDIAAYTWNFGDTNTSTSVNPTHQYTASGNYNIQLDVTADNGCQNFTRDTIKIYDLPSAAFVLPSGPHCTNNEFTFVNATTDNFDGYLSYQWLVNNQTVSTVRDLMYTLTLEGSNDITLEASIPGCMDEVTQTIANVIEGPVPDFSFTGHCEDENIVFTNNSSGTVSGYSWNFDDGQNSTDTNPIHSYSDQGVYDVTLTASNATGCNNTNTKSLTIYSKPQVSFHALQPPFSCNGTPTELRDLTPNPTDSNLSSWQWNFGDAGSGQNTSTSQDPQHTYALAGNYDVTLTVATNFDCSATLQLPVTISQTPVSNFSFTPPCDDILVNFSGTSVDAIQSWSWQIGAMVYSLQNPAHTFINPGTYNAQLWATADNDCVGFIDSTIVVPNKLVPNFTFTKNCTNQQTLFTDITNATADPINIYDWEVIGGGTASGSPAVFIFPSLGTPNVKLTVTTQTGCDYSITKPVSIISSPTANFTASPETGGPPLDVQFTNTSVNATSYLWSFNDGNNSTSTMISPLFTYPNLGQYRANLTAFNAQDCSHTFSKTIDVITPLVDVALNGLELMEFQNGAIKPAVTIFNRGNIPLSNLALLLDVSGSVIREYVGAVIMPNSSYRHVFQFEFPNTNTLDYFCIEAEIDDITLSDNTTCLSLEQSFTTFAPHPNPSNGVLNVNWIINEDGLVNVTLINSMGQSVKNVQVSCQEGLNPFTIKTTGLGSGVYFLKINYRQITKVYRVLISE